MIDYNKLLKKFNKKENIYLYLKKNTNLKNSEITKISYDIQSGSYVRNYFDEKKLKRALIFKPVIDEINKFKPKNILDFGTGETTSLVNLIEQLDKNITFYASDISFNRLFMGINFLKKKLSKNKLSKINLFCNSHLKLPFKDNSIDLVTTCHSIEPNGSYKEIILKELARVARKGLVLLEPHFEIASKATKTRMKKFGYIKNLEGSIKKLNLKYQIIKKDHHISDINPASIFVIKKKKLKKNSSNYVDPIYKTKLNRIDNFYYSDFTKKIYPVINGITIFSNDCNLHLPRIKSKSIKYIPRRNLQ